MKLNLLKEVQKIQVKMLIEVDRICKKHNIKYQLYGGTLLGAIRHQGFIPWDDDIDIAMLRTDYIKFLKIAPQELSNNYFLQTPETDKHSAFSFAKVRKNNTIFIEKGTKTLDIHQGIFIDIFPLDNISLDKHTKKIINKLKILIAMNIRSNSRFVFNKKKLLLQPLKFILRIFRLPTSYYQNKIDKLIIKLNNEESDFVNHLTNGITNNRFERFLMKKEDALNLIDVEFEGHNFPATANYHEFLTRCYGDYMVLPPVDKQQPHHGSLISIDGTTIFDGFNDTEGRKIDESAFKIK